MSDQTIIEPVEEKVTAKPKSRKPKADVQIDGLTVKRVPSAKIEAMGAVPTVMVKLPLPPQMADDPKVAKVEFVTHNGYKYEIKLGYTVPLPIPVFMILKQGKYKNVDI